MKNLRNVLLLKQLSLLKQLGYRYTDEDVTVRDVMWLDLPSHYHALADVASSCTLCQFCKSRKRVVFGSGDTGADLMFVGFVPNEQSDTNGNIWSNPYAQMLSRMITNVIEIDINKVYYTNILKCLPLQSISNFKNEILQCKPFIEKEIEIVSPKLIVCLGEMAYSYISDNAGSFESSRGEILRTKKRYIMPIYDPEFLERNPSAKKETMSDLLKIKQFLQRLH